MIARRTTRAVLNRIVLAESDCTVIVEGNHYFPPDAVKWEHLQPSRTRTLCPWKGIATYQHAIINGQIVTNAAWVYRRPLPFARRIRGHVAFSPFVTIEAATPRDPGHDRRG